MLWFALAVAFIVLVFWRGCCKDWSIGLMACLTIISVFVGIITPLCINLGYNEKQLETKIQLVSLGTDITSTGSGSRRYVTISGEKVYTYRYEVENTTELSGTMYKTDTVSGNVEEIESAECNTPMLYIYVEKTKNSWWFSVYTQDRYSYVFYVPEGTIVRDVTLD